MINYDVYFVEVCSIHIFLLKTSDEFSLCYIVIAVSTKCEATLKVRQLTGVSHMGSLNLLHFNDDVTSFNQTDFYI